MKEFDLSTTDYKLRKDIFDAIKSGRFSPQEVIDIIKDHNNMYFGTKDLTHEFTNIIMFAHNYFRDNIAKYIALEFKEEIDFSYLTYIAMIHDVDAIIVSDYFDNIDIYKMETDINSLIIQPLKAEKDDYFEILLDTDILNSLTEQNITMMFHSYTKRLMMQEIVVERWKKVLSEFKFIDNIMLRIVSKDLELLNIYYPDINELFIF